MKFEKPGFDFLGSSWRKSCNAPEPPKPEVFDFEELKITEWSPKFEHLMRNRMIMGAFRYGKLHGKNKPQYDRMNSLKKRIDLYIETGNKEHLVDGANMLLLEFEEGVHPKAHFKAIDDGEHTQKV